MSDHGHHHHQDQAAHAHAAGGHDGQGHSHGPASYDAAFAVGTALNLGFVAAEVVFGLAANSVALLADAAHNFGDVLGLLLAWGAAWLSRRPPTPDRTYGWGRSSILAALTNAVILLIGVGAIALESVQRLLEPAPVAGTTVMAVAAAGVVVNGATALLFMRGRENDINIRGAFLHMASDAVVSLGVVLAAFVIGLTGWFWLDPVASLVIVVVITVATWGLLRDSLNMAMDAVPGGVARDAVRDWLRGLPGVVEVHDLHIWGLSTTETAVTAHLVCDQEGPRGGVLEMASSGLRERFGIGHATLQVETREQAVSCRLRPETVI